MHARTVVGLAVTALAVTACSSGGASDGLGAGEDYSVQGALAELPPGPSGEFLVQTADLTAATELAGLERPTELDAGATAGWIGPLTGAPLPGGTEWAPVFAPVLQSVDVTMTSLIEEFDEQAGWSLIDVDSFAELSAAPRTFAVISGDFEETALEHLPEVADGVRTVGEGEDRAANMSEPSALNRIGQPVRMAQVDGKIAVSPDTDPVQDWLGETEESLADHPGLSALAEALDEQDVVSAMLSTGGDYSAIASVAANLPEQSREAMLERMSALPEQQFSAVAAGWTVEDDEPLMVLAYYFGGEETAESAVESVETMLTEGVTTGGRPVSDFFEGAEVTADGPVVTATLRPANAQAPHQLPRMLMLRDVPFLHQ